MNISVHITGRFDAWIFPCVNVLFWNEQSRKFIILLACGRLVNSNVANSVWKKLLLYLKQTYSMLLNCGLKIVWHEIYLFKFKTKCFRVPQVRQLYINYSTFRQRLVCFILNNYVHVLMNWVSNNLVLVLGGTGQTRLPPTVRQMSARFSRKNNTGPERAVEIKPRSAYQPENTETSAEPNKGFSIHFLPFVKIFVQLEKGFTPFSHFTDSNFSC